MRMTYQLRRIDVCSRRAVRHAVIAWHHAAIKASMRATDIAIQLSESRKVQDGALYVCGFAVVMMLVTGVLG